MDYQQSNKRPISPVNNGEEHVKRGRLSLSDSILPEVALSEDTCLYPGQSPMHDNVKALLSDNAHETLRNAVPVIGNDHEECASPLIGVSENLSNLHDMVIDAEDLFQTVPRYSNPAGEAESNGGDISTGRLGVEATVKAREPSVESTTNSVITTADLDQDMCTLSRTCAMEHSQNPSDVAHSVRTCEVILTGEKPSRSSSPSEDSLGEDVDSDDSDSEGPPLPAEELYEIERNGGMEDMVIRPKGRAWP